MSTLIKPTVGRVIWYYLDKDHFDGKSLGAIDNQPFDAHVIYVHSDREINVSGHNHNGTPFSVTHVPLLQEDDVAPESGPFATWMPYQVGQAKKES